MLGINKKNRWPTAAVWSNALSIIFKPSYAIRIVLNNQIKYHSWLLFIQNNSFIKSIFIDKV